MWGGVVVEVFEWLIRLRTSRDLVFRISKRPYISLEGFVVGDPHLVIVLTFLSSKMPKQRSSKLPKNRISLHFVQSKALKRNQNVCRLL